MKSICKRNDRTGIHADKRYPYPPSLLHFYYLPGATSTLKMPTLINTF
jgi:hypothetical protein